MEQSPKRIKEDEEKSVLARVFQLPEELQATIAQFVNYSDIPLLRLTQQDAYSPEVPYDYTLRQLSYYSIDNDAIFRTPFDTCFLSWQFWTRRADQSVVVITVTFTTNPNDYGVTIQSNAILPEEVNEVYTLILHILHTKVPSYLLHETVAFKVSTILNVDNNGNQRISEARITKDNKIVLQDDNQNDFLVYFAIALFALTRNYKPTEIEHYDTKYAIADELRYSPAATINTAWQSKMLDYELASEKLWIEHKWTAHNAMYLYITLYADDISPEVVQEVMYLTGFYTAKNVVFHNKTVVFDNNEPADVNHVSPQFKIKLRFSGINAKRNNNKLRIESIGYWPCAVRDLVQCLYGTDNVTESFWLIQGNDTSKQTIATMAQICGATQHDQWSSKKLDWLQFGTDSNFVIYNFPELLVITSNDSMQQPLLRWAEFFIKKTQQMSRINGARVARKYERSWLLPAAAKRIAELVAQNKHPFQFFA